MKIHKPARVSKGYLNPVYNFKISLGIILMLFLGFPLLLFSGEFSNDSTKSDSIQKNTECVPTDIVELIFKKSFLEQHEEKWFNIIVIPFLGYAPATGLQVGAGASWTLKTSLGTNTNLSAGMLQAYYTWEKQLVTQLRTNIYTHRNLWFLQGDCRFYLFQQPTYGLGTSSQSFTPLPTDLPGTQVSPEQDGKYPMKYNWFKLHEIFSRKVTKGLYAGVGYHLDYHFDIRDEELKTDSSILYTTPHYSYCRKHGFNDKEYLASGLSLNIVFDSRDNILNPYKGIYANVNFRSDFTWLGSNKNNSRVWAEFRSYLSLSKKLPRHLIAFWTFGTFQTGGSIPYLDLMSNAFDQMSSSGRGYPQGRWRGQDVAYAEIEYRFPISQCSQVLGGVLFLNFISTSDRDKQIPLMEYIKPAGGFGLRICVNKNDRTNVAIDYAFGEGCSGLYFQVQEIF